MATQFAASNHSLRPMPFMLARVVPAPIETGFAEALRIAIAAERASAEGRRPCQRVARLLCELGKNIGCGRRLPLSRAEVAAALGISLIRVKRSLALLALSGVVGCEETAINVLDWRKLSGVARVDPFALGISSAEDDEAPCRSDEREPQFLTATGDPACFV